MRFAIVILTVCVTLLRADRSQLPNLGIARRLILPDLGTAQSFLPSIHSNANNVHHKATFSKHSSQSIPQPFELSQNIPLADNIQFSTNLKNTTPDRSFLPVTAEAGVSLDGVDFFDKDLHEPDTHVPPFPIIPFNRPDNKHNSQNTGHGLAPSPIPQPFNIDGNVQVNPSISNPTVGGDIGFSGPFNHQGNHVGSQPHSFDFNQQEFTGVTPSYPDEATRPAVNNFSPPTLIHNDPNHSNGNREPINNRNEDIPVDPFAHHAGVDIENRHQEPSIDQNLLHGISEGVDKLEDILKQEWADFRTRFNKVYSSVEEENFRREVFFENREKIMRFNMDYAEGRRNFVHKINPYADLLLHEFTSQHCGFNKSRIARHTTPQQASAFVPSANVVFPSSVDWREVGAVGPVKTQGKCAACWAFAAAGALEGHHYRKSGNLVDISVQNLIDCTEPYGNNGCSGGLMDPAFEYVRDNNGVDSEQSYPFEERTAECRFKREDVVASCTGFVDIGENDEKGLEIALATLGPVTAAIDAARETFQFYSDGIYDDPECGNTPEKMNHAVLIVGYGTDPDGRKYWLIKNSYGPQWGIGGYMKLAKDNNNQCGIAIQASYPLV